MIDDESVANKTTKDTQVICPTCGGTYTLGPGEWLTHNGSPEYGTHSILRLYPDSDLEDD